MEWRIGSRVKRKDESVPWRIVGIDQESETVTLSGPGPCRSVRVESWVEIDVMYEPVQP